VVVICSPHPDDEAIVGLLPYRLRQEGWRVVNLAMTLGSRFEEHGRRRGELECSCASLGFECRYPFEDLSGGFLRASKEAQREDALAGFGAVLDDLGATIVLAPHLADAHPTHVSVGNFVREAIKTLNRRPQLYVESEFWATMPEPNCIVEATPLEVSELVRALAEHEGEVRRNPYHLTLPAWMEDSARRGTELVGGFGSSSGAPFRFASSYLVSAIDSEGELLGHRPVLWQTKTLFRSRIRV
jgi:LmbE family N-acetylglucosaminyl deacetylase